VQAQDGICPVKVWPPKARHPHRLPSYKTKSVYLNQMIDVDNSAFDYIVRELFIKFRMANDQKYVIREFVCWCTGGIYS
jgi:hypothetical protein